MLQGVFDRRETQTGFRLEAQNRPNVDGAAPQSPARCPIITLNIFTSGADGHEGLAAIFADILLSPPPGSRE
ncbi:putative DNA binding helix-turn helix protein [Anopheles sinensis]|uniref:Putative DNA binding helix-turn helix protein n=1 Tax=Anopheles sinensis TaxID=74873 RepID=A0A084W8Y5_ANOSI|nr:putative DNA binding helix-turn helix protein [Anopheles sinensis]